GLAKIETTLDGRPQQPWRPKAVYHYIQSQFIEPDFIVDISDFWEVKVASYMAYKSQMYDPQSKEPETYISKPEFLKLIEARAVELGHAIGVKYGEGYTLRRFPGVRNLFDLV
ncbi:MAG: bacillithiol biosynthesis deacetylase BshB1, partial [Pseudomonadota bacterium]